MKLVSTKTSNHKNLLSKNRLKYNYNYNTITNTVTGTLYLGNF